VWGAHFYFWGRIAYAILYLADLPLARSLVWNLPTFGILMYVAGLFAKARPCCAICLMPPSAATRN